MSACHSSVCSRKFLVCLAFDASVERLLERGLTQVPGHSHLLSDYFVSLLAISEWFVVGSPDCESFDCSESMSIMFSGGIWKKQSYRCLSIVRSILLGLIGPALRVGDSMRLVVILLVAVRVAHQAKYLILSRSCTSDAECCGRDCYASFECSWCGECLTLLF